MATRRMRREKTGRARMGGRIPGCFRHLRRSWVWCWTTVCSRWRRTSLRCFGHIQRKGRGGGGGGCGLWRGLIYFPRKVPRSLFLAHVPCFFFFFATLFSRQGVQGGGSGKDGTREGGIAEYRISNIELSLIAYEVLHTLNSFFSFMRPRDGKVGGVVWWEDMYFWSPDENPMRGGGGDVGCCGRWPIRHMCGGVFSLLVGSSPTAAKCVCVCCLCFVGSSSKLICIFQRPAQQP